MVIQRNQSTSKIKSKIDLLYNYDHELELEESIDAIKEDLINFIFINDIKRQNLQFNNLKKEI